MSVVQCFEGRFPQKIPLFPDDIAVTHGPIHFTVTASTADSYASDQRRLLSEEERLFLLRVHQILFKAFIHDHIIQLPNKHDHCYTKKPNSDLSLRRYSESYQK